MDIRDHESKALRFEASLGKLRAEEDGEAVIWACMQAGTHWVNAALHRALPTFPDIEHTDVIGFSPRDPDRLLRPRWPIDLPVPLRQALDHLAAIEALRPRYVRGPRMDAAGAGAALREYAGLRRELGLPQGVPGARDE